MEADPRPVEVPTSEAITRLLLLAGVGACLWHWTRALARRQRPDDPRVAAWLVGALALWVLALAPDLGKQASAGLLLVAGMWGLYALDAAASSRADAPQPRGDGPRLPWHDAGAGP